MVLQEAVYTIFDFETTGLFPYSGDKICEIGAIKICPRHKQREAFHTLVNPERPISSGAFMVNRITHDMVKDAPRIQEVMPDFMRFIHGSILVAYNAGFDIGFLDHALGEEGRSLLSAFRVIDALRLARQLFPNLERYTLSSVADFLGIRFLKEHRAMHDATMTLGVFQKELTLLIERGARTVEDIERISPEKEKPLTDAGRYTISVIRKAINEQRRLNITYRSSWNNELTRRVITPRQIESSYNRSYLVAYCHLRKAKRNFRLDSIIEARVEEIPEKKR